MIIENQKVITFTDKELKALRDAKYILDNIKNELDGATMGKVRWNSKDFSFASNLLYNLLATTVRLKLVLNNNEINT